MNNRKLDFENSKVGTAGPLKSANVRLNLRGAVDQGGIGRVHLGKVHRGLWWIKNFVRRICAEFGGLKRTNFTWQNKRRSPASTPKST